MHFPNKYIFFTLAAVLIVFSEYVCGKQGLSRALTKRNHTTTSAPFYRRHWWLKKVPVLHHLCYPFYRLKKYVNVCYRNYEIYCTRENGTTMNPYKILTFRFLLRKKWWSRPPWLRRIRQKTPKAKDMNAAFEFHKFQND